MPSATETRSAAKEDPNNLGDLLSETRILLPGTQVFLGFLTTMPFTDRFAHLEPVQRYVYLLTFFGALLALVCFVLPAAYHRIARPIRNKQRFKVLASRFLVAGLVPLSIAIVLVTWLITSVVVRPFAWLGAGTMLVAIGTTWWLVPFIRAHDHVGRRARAPHP